MAHQKTMSTILISRTLLWVLLVMVLFVLSIRLLESTWGVLFGKEVEVFLLVLIGLVVLWLLGNKAKR